MNELSAFKITQKWPPRHPDRIQLYSLPTPNGVKISIMLEETGLPYEPHLVRFDTHDQNTPEFLSINPNGKIPAILDPHGPGRTPLALFESGAILIYLAEKSGLFMPREPARRYETIQWLMFQMSGIGPMFGQVGFFNKFAGKDYEDKRRCNATSPNRGVYWPCSIGVLARALGLWAMTTGSPTSVPFPGSAISSASTMPANWRV
jgi:GST-like protein